jgi:hypothetical protein
VGNISEQLIYVPKADKYNYGIIKLGDGFYVDEDGNTNFDSSKIKIEEIQKNGIKIEPVNKVVNLVLSKSDFDLDQVDNTSDLNKPVSAATRDAINALDVKLTESITTHYEEFEENKETVNNKILTLTQTVTMNKSNADSEILRLEGLIKGKEQAVAFPTYKDVVDDMNMAATNKYPVGQPVYVQTINVPDLWVCSVENTHVDYLYSTDEEIINSLEETGTVQIGYYKLAMMETKTTDVTNAVTLDSVQTITGTKIFTTQIGILNGAEGEINYIKHINNNLLISSSDGDNILNIDEQLRSIKFYNKPIALEEYVDNNFISFVKTQNLTESQKEIARNNIGAGTGGGAGGTTVYVAGEVQTTWSADSKLDVQNATSTGNTELRYDNGFYVYTTGDNKFKYNGSEVATKLDIETNIIAALNTEV